MFRARFATARLLALLLPMNMLWVFFACTVQCMELAETAGFEQTGAVACCAAEADTACDAGTTLSDVDDHRCLVAAAELGVMSSHDPSARATVTTSAAPPAFLLFESGRAAPERRVIPASSPPLPWPLDRLPLLRI